MLKFSLILVTGLIFVGMGILIFLKEALPQTSAFDRFFITTWFIVGIACLISSVLFVIENKTEKIKN